MHRLQFVLPLLTLLIALALGATGCLSNVPDVDCSTADVPSYSDMTVWDQCTPCHRSYGNYSSAAADADAAQQAVADGKMPRGQYSLTPEEEDSLYAWAQCGTPP